MTHFTFIDGGYLAWSYGCTDERIGYWNANRQLYTWRSQSVILMDTVGPTARFHYDATYKSRRRDKRAADADWTLRTISVIRFKESLERDPDLNLFQFEGLEADDLLATMAYHHPNLPIDIVGVDKDLLQIPEHRAKIKRLDGSEVNLASYRHRLPVGLQHSFQTHRHVNLILAIYGDKSDSIPRLLPLHRLDILSKILRSPKPFTTAYNTFGKEFLRNLYLTVLPGPWCYDPVPDPATVYELVRSGKYPGDLKLRQDLEEMAVAIEANRAPADVW